MPAILDRTKLPALEVLALFDEVLEVFVKEDVHLIDSHCKCCEKKRALQAKLEKAGLL